MRWFLTLVMAALPAVAAPQAELQPAAILANPEWRAVYDEYLPGYGLMAAFSSGVEDGLQIEVFFADWCEDSRAEVPRFIKLVHELDNPRLEVHYFGGIEHKAEGAKYFVDKDKIEKIPTFVVIRNGQEIGRIVEHPKEGFLEDLLEMIY